MNWIRPISHYFAAIALMLVCGGCGGAYQTRLPGGELAITPASFTAGVYQGTYSDPTDSFGLGTGGQVIWYHTLADANRLILMSAGSASVMSLTLGQNSSAYLVNGALGNRRLSLDSFKIGTFHGQSVDGGPPITLDFTFQHP